MNISYNWLKKYLDFDLNPQETAAALTSLGLETGSVEEIQTIKGGLEGLVVGKVLTCTAHPNSDHLHITTVDAGLGGEPLQIVCGAANVAAGQKVIVALNGTKLYKDQECFTIKKSKIRGTESNGMLCAEDEIGVGQDHSGIIVLPEDTPVGMPAKDYYRVESDYVLEVDITPNRVDATSHFGVARDLSAWLRRNGRPYTLHRPAPEAFRIDKPEAPCVQVKVENEEACLRYTGLTIRGVTVKESPAWLQTCLKNIGLRPIDNVVDVTNYILHGIGQPLHSFDADKVKDGQVIVKTLPAGTKFVTLDGVERTLTERDLMICNPEEGMCIAGVFGGLESGVTAETKNVFLEAATFHPTWIRKTARRFGLNTDASFRYERGLDPNQALWALQCAALLIKEVAGGEICGPVQDIYPQPVASYPVELSFAKIDALVGKQIPRDVIRDILGSLEITIVGETAEGLSLQVPPYRYDVRRDVDVIEDILRVYGYNNVEVSENLRANLTEKTAVDQSYKLQEIISEQLCGEGFQEIWNNSLSKQAYYEHSQTWPVAQCVRVLNALSTDLCVMRQTLLFGGLESIGHNEKRKNPNLRFFEFGNCYNYKAEKKKEGQILSGYGEEFHLGLWLSGKYVENNWAHPDEAASPFQLKAALENIFRRLGISAKALSYQPFTSEVYAQGMEILTAGGKRIATWGVLQGALLKAADVDTDVFYAELSWKQLMKEAGKNQVNFSPLGKFQPVKRDMALLVDRSLAFADIEKTARDSERKFLKDIVLFDVYEGKNLPEGKKSYAVSFYLLNEEKPFTDKQIDSIMKKIQSNLEQKLGAQQR